MTKSFNFALKIKGGGREGSRSEILRPCHPPKIWNVHMVSYQRMQSGLLVFPVGEFCTFQIFL